MHQNYLPLDRSPLVNFRRAIKRSNTKRQANLFIDPDNTRSALKELYAKASSRYFNQENLESAEQQTRFSYNERRLRELGFLNDLRRSESNAQSQGGQSQLVRVNKGNREFRIKRYQNSQARCKSELANGEKQEQIDLQSNITVFNLIPRKSYLEKQREKSKEIEQEKEKSRDRGKKRSLTEEGSLLSLKSVPDKGQLRLKFNVSVLSQHKINESRKKKSVKRMQFCPWNFNETFYNSPNLDQQQFLM